MSVYICTLLCNIDYRSADELINYCAQVAFNLSLALPTKTNNENHQTDLSADHQPPFLEEKSNNTEEKRTTSKEDKDNKQHVDELSGAVSTLGEEEDSSVLSSLNAFDLIPLAKQLALLPEIYAVIESLVEEGNINANTNDIEQTNLDE